MKLYYTEGPQFMTCGIAGQFKLGVPREVPDDLAAILLRKGRLKEFREDLTTILGEALGTATVEADGAGYKHTIVPSPASPAKRKTKEE